jgi:hypothetical protein
VCVCVSMCACVCVRVTFLKKSEAEISEVTSAMVTATREGG